LNAVQILTLQSVYRGMVSTRRDYDTHQVLVASAEEISLLPEDKILLSWKDNNSHSSNVKPSQELKAVGIAVAG